MQAFLFSTRSSIRITAGNPTCFHKGKGKQKSAYFAKNMQTFYAQHGAPSGSPQVIQLVFIRERGNKKVHVLLKTCRLFMLNTELHQDHRR